MGPPSEKGGIVRSVVEHTRGRYAASMGPPSEKGGIAESRSGFSKKRLASMGPPSEKGGINRDQG